MSGRRRGGVRILVDGEFADVEHDKLDLADDYGVCVGLDRQCRGAWWRLVSTHVSYHFANRAFNKLDKRRGRALVFLQHDDILVIDLAGKPLAVSS